MMEITAICKTFILFVKHLFVKYSMVFIKHQPRPSLQPARLESTVFPRIVSVESILFRSCQLRLLNEGSLA